MDQNYTDHVINAMGPKTMPRLRKVLGSLIQHIVPRSLSKLNRSMISPGKTRSLSRSGWLGMQLINSIGKISDEKRDEAILVSDVLGMES